MYFTEMDSVCWAFAERNIRGNFMLRFLGNLLWFLLGGFVVGLGWILAGIVYCISIIGVPIGVQCFKFAGLVMCPFGKQILYPAVRVGKTLANILWILLFGWHLALSSAVLGIVFCITIIGIPFGKQYFKIAQLALMPFGAEIVPV